MSIFSKIFGGSREREKDQEYIEYLLDEVEKLKEQKIEEVKKEKEKNSQEKEAVKELQAALEQIKAEKAELERQFDEYKEQEQVKTEEEDGRQDQIETCLLYTSCFSILRRRKKRQDRGYEGLCSSV